MNVRIFKRDGESGQTMVFGAISLFLLVTFAALVFNTGQVVTARIEVQNAADAAARSGALTEANIVSTVAFLNDGMAFIYYNMMRYATNVTVFGVLAELKESGPPYPTDAVVGVADAPAQYDLAFAQADQMLPQCYEWLNVIKRVEQAMAASGRTLIQREINRTAVENAKRTVGGESKGIEAIAMFPDFDLLPYGGGYLRLDIDQIEPNLGWSITSNTGYTMEVRRLGPQHWLITAADGSQYEIENTAPNEYIVRAPGRNLYITRPGPNQLNARLDGTPPVEIECYFLDGLGWAINAVTPGVSVTYEPWPAGGYKITTTPGGSVIVRRGQSGELEEWNGYQWVPVQGQQGEVQVGGRTIPVQQTNVVSLPAGASLELPNTIHMGGMTFSFNPGAATLSGTSITFGGTGIELRDDGVRIRSSIGPATVFIDDRDGADPQLEVNYLTLRDADGRWRVLSERGNRHRMQWPDPSDNFWIYEWVENAAYLLDGDIQRLGYHAVYDQAGAPPAWTQWFNPDTGNLTAPADYYQSRESWSAPLTNYTDPDTGDEYVRRYASDMFHRNRGQYMSINMNSVPRPLRLTEDFLKFGINIAVWRDKTTPILEGNTKGRLRFNMFENPDWGYFAVSCARAAFLDNTMDPPQWRYTFSTSAEIEDFINNSYQNLYEPVWTAMLVSSRESVVGEHIDVIDPDTGTSFVWRGLAGGTYTWVGQTHDGATWYDPDPPEEYIQFRRSKAGIAQKFRQIRNRQGATFDHTSTQLPDVIDH